MKTTILIVLSTFLSLLSFTIQAQEKWEWEFIPKFSKGRAVLETENTLWINASTAILEVDLPTQEINIHHYRSMLPDAEPPDFHTQKRFRGLWIDGNGRIGSFLDDGSGFMRQDGNSWEYVPFGFAPFYYPQKIIGRQADGHLLIDRGGVGEIYRWHPDQPNVRFELVEDVLISGNEYVLDDHQTLWAHSTINDTLFAQRGLAVETIVVPSNHQDRIQTFVTQQGEIWAYQKDALFYKHPEGDWLSLSIDLEIEDNQWASLLSASFGTAYLFIDQQIYKLQIVEGATIDLQNLSALGADCCRSRFPLAASRDNGLYYINNRVPRIFRISEEEEVKSLSTRPFTIEDATSLTCDPEGRIWAGGVSNSLFFSSGQWEHAEQVFPDFPSPVYDIEFRDPFTPVVLNFELAAYHLQEYKAGQWQLLEDMANDEPPTLSHRTKINIDPFNRIWQRTFTRFARWEHQRWWYDLLGDYFPRTSSSLENLQVDDEGRIFITGNVQLIVRDGGYYESYDLEELGFTNLSNANNRLSSDFDDEGNLFISNRNEVIKWEDGNIQHFPSLNLLQTEELWDTGIRKIFAFADDDLWVAFQHDLSVRLAHFNGESWSYFSNYRRYDWDNDYFDLVKDGEGRVWVNTREGIYIIYTPEQSSPDSYDVVSNDSQLTIAPNPGCCAFQVFWEQNEAGPVTIELFNLNGVRMKLIEDAHCFAGPQSQFFTADEFTPGTYVVRLISGKQSIVSKVVIH